jgi:hypothetical protein
LQANSGHLQATIGSSTVQKEQVYFDPFSSVTTKFEIWRLMEKEKNEKSTHYAFQTPKHRLIHMQLVSILI